MAATYKQRKASGVCSLKLLVMYSLAGMMCLYVSLMVILAQHTRRQPHGRSNSIHGEQASPHHLVRVDGERLKEWGHNVQPKVLLKDRRMQMLPGIRHGVPLNIHKLNQPKHLKNAQSNDKIPKPDIKPPLILTAFMEPIHQEDWNVKPLQLRATARAESLTSRTYPGVNACSKLPQQWPVNCGVHHDDDTSSPVSQDPFLPWIHDVFPTPDGTTIQFVAQNHRRCRTGTTPDEVTILEQQQPQVSLFQHVPVKRVPNTGGDDGAQRYRLASHEDADIDGMETRFICRFKDHSGKVLGETLSFFNTNYEYASFRKRHKHMASKEGRDTKLMHTSQLNFQCPVPDVKINDDNEDASISLRHLIQTGQSVNERTDTANYYVDVIPIRTPPRYGRPNAFFPPYYSEFQLTPVDEATGTPNEDYFDPKAEWGLQHILPKIEDSGRWENIPICKPSALTYGTPESIASAHVYADQQAKEVAKHKGDEDEPFDLRETRHDNSLLHPPQNAASPPQKQHRLVSCLWASTGYATRGNRFAINDGQRRLMEFINYYEMIGVEHFYVYDNSGAFSDKFDEDGVPLPSLREITDQFPPSKVTWINWPSKICNNNPNNVDSVGERSSQYSAESSCRLRFGPHTDWIAQMDIDEYLVPMGSNDSTKINPVLLDRLDEEGTKIISFGSWRAWPRRKFVADPNASRLSGAQNCGTSKWDCFGLEIPVNETILQSYNCDRQKPGEKKSHMPAEKQLYRPDYVKQHFIHYSTITAMSELNRKDFLEYGPKEGNKHVWKTHGAFPDPLSRFGDEVTEALMLHTKAVATQDTGGWESVCKAGYDGRALCRLGNPFPVGEAAVGVDVEAGDENGLSYNCYVNHKIDDHLVPMLEDRLQHFVPELAKKLEKKTG